VQALELAAIPLDAARRTTLRVATRSRVLTRVLARRDSRVACLATLQIVILFALSIRVPVALFFLGPVVFGVVHVAADVRYLVLHRRPPRVLVLASAAIALAITAARIGVGAHVLPARMGDTVDVLLGMTWVGVALGVGARERPRAVLAVAPVFVGAAWLLVARAHLVNLAFVHGHNLVALVAWLFLFRRQRRWAALPLALVAGGAAVLLSGALLPWTVAIGGFSAFGVSSTRFSAWLAPGVRGDLALALTTSFVFLQGVHYAAWTAWIPQDDLRTEGTPTFRMSIRALSKDFGRLAFGCIVLAAVAFVVLAVWNVRESVTWYMTLAKAHAWLELAFLAYFVVRQEGRAIAP
jgi:hypothetical protein